MILFLPSSARLGSLRSPVPLKVTEDLSCSMSFLIISEALSFTKEFDSEHIIAMFKYNELEFHFRNWIPPQLNILKLFLGTDSDGALLNAASDSHSTCCSSLSTQYGDAS